MRYKRKRFKKKRKDPKRQAKKLNEMAYAF